MKKNIAMLLAFLLICCSCAFAQEAEENILPFDLEGYFSTGVGIAQVQPLSSWEEAVVAGLPLQSEPYKTNRSRSDDTESPLNRQYYLEEGTVVTFLGLRMKAASFQFTDDHITDFQFYLEEKLTPEQIVPMVSEIIGEPTDERSLPLDNSSNSTMTTFRWNLEVDGQIVGLSITAIDDTVMGIGGAYWSAYWELIGVDPSAQSAENTAN